MGQRSPNGFRDRRGSRTSRPNFDTACSVVSFTGVKTPANSGLHWFVHVNKPLVILVDNHRISHIFRVSAIVNSKLLLAFEDQGRH